VTDLRAGLLKAETAVATYKSQNNIVDAAGTLVNERELNEINTQLVNARAQLGETQARFDRIQALIDRKDVGNATINDVINSTSVQRLRGQYQDLARRESDIRRRLGPQHGAVIQTRQEMAETERQILEEFERIAEGMRSELAIVRQRVESLEKAQRDATSVAQRTNEKRVKLGELERDLNASRSLYESFLTRFKTTAQDESFPISEARVVTEAAPARFPSHPKSLLVLALAGGAGVLLGVGLGLMRERLDDVIRSGEDLEAVTGTEMLGVVPSFGDDITRQKISRHTLANVRKLTPVQQTERLLPHDLGYLRYAVDYPFSRTAETMRSVKLALQFAAAPADDCVVGIVSALPNEGKSSVAANLAHHLASTGSRTLLIDCDLRNPSITRQIAGRTPGGLPDILYRNGSLESLVFVDPVTGMHFLSAGTRSAIHQTDELLGSDRMREFLQMLKKGYDYVVLDLPPIVPTVDARAIAPVVDAFVYVVEWGKTPREVVRQALRSSDQITSRLVGSVLNKVRHDSLRLYDSYAALTYGQDYGATPSPKKDRAA
jgi:succinoglycan biosynthesis transport protein ExoP